MVNAKSPVTIFPYLADGLFQGPLEISGDPCVNGKSLLGRVSKSANLFVYIAVIGHVARVLESYDRLFLKPPTLLPST